MSASMSVSFGTRFVRTPVTQENVNERIETAISTHLPILEEARAIHEVYQKTRGSGSVAEVADLMARVSQCLARLNSSDLENEMIAVKAFFSGHMTYIQEKDGTYSNDPFLTKSGRLVHPSRWQIHPLTSIGADRDLFVPLFPKFQEIGRIHYELMVGDEETSKTHSLQASLSGIQAALTHSHFHASPVDAQVSSHSPDRSASPSLSVSGISDVSSVSSESISAELATRIAPSSIKNIFHKNGWQQLEAIRIDALSGHSEDELKFTFNALHARIRREVYKEIAAANGVVTEFKGADWGKLNWFKTEQRQTLFNVIATVQEKCESGSIDLLISGQ